MLSYNYTVSWDFRQGGVNIFCIYHKKASPFRGIFDKDRAEAACFSPVFLQSAVRPCHPVSPGCVRDMQAPGVVPGRLVSFTQTICRNVKYPLDERAKKEYNNNKNKLKEGISLD